MDVFDLGPTLIEDRAEFKRPLTTVWAKDRCSEVELIYESRRLWPEPLRILRYQRQALAKAAAGQVLPRTVVTRSSLRQRSNTSGRRHWTNPRWSRTGRGR